MNDFETTMWLVQPVSPALNHQGLADKLGFVQVLGVLDRNLVDDPHRMVLVMGPAFDSEELMDRRLRESKFVAGFKREQWVLTEDGYPFDQPDFAIHPLDSQYVRQGIEASNRDQPTGDEHFFKHSSKLPEFPGE